MLYVPVQVWFNEPLPTFPSRFCIWHWRWGQEAWTVRGGLKAGTISEAPAQLRNDISNALHSTMQCVQSRHQKHHSVCVKKTYQKHHSVCTIKTLYCAMCANKTYWKHWLIADISLTYSLHWAITSRLSVQLCIFVFVYFSGLSYSRLCDE